MEGLSQLLVILLKRVNKCDEQLVGKQHHNGAGDDFVSSGSSERETGTKGDGGRVTVKTDL